MSIRAASREQLALTATIWRAGRWLTVLGTALLVVAPVLTVAIATASGQVVSAVIAEQPWAQVSALVGVLVVSMALTPLAESAASLVAGEIDARRLVDQHVGLAGTALAPAGIGHLEKADVRSRLTAEATALGDWRNRDAASHAFTVVTLRLTGIACLIGLAVQWHWWIGVVVAAAEYVMGARFRRYIATLLNVWMPEPGSARIRARYLGGLLTSSTAAKEVRLFGLGDWVLRTWQVQLDLATDDPGQRSELRRSLRWAWLLTLAYGLAFGLLAVEVWRGDVAAGQVLTILQLLALLSYFGMLGDQQSATIFAGKLANRSRRLRESLREATGHAPRAVADGATEVPPPDGLICRLRDVHFHYPGAERPVLDGLNLDIPRGQTLGVVGANGAGKSTMIKLLTGLYRPDSGTVEVTGIPADHAGAVSAILQHFTHWELSLRDNVTLGADLTPEEVRAALAEAGTATFADEIDLDTPLSAKFPGGRDLSGGQWQRVALARALATIPRGAEMLVLDEPTSALDIRAEAALFDDFANRTRDITTVLVTHRLSSVRHADRIVVIDAGRVVEDGTHDELLALGGRYHEMFTVQARRFHQSAQDGRPEQLQQSGYEA